MFHEVAYWYGHASARQQVAIWLYGEQGITRRAVVGSAAANQKLERPMHGYLCLVVWYQRGFCAGLMHELEEL